MNSITVWQSANRPNYTTNIDKRFPYSEVPFLGQYALLQIPVFLDDHIPHIDYWGEGKVVSDKGIRGFSNCYNVNHQYRLVSAGLDLDRKIPNRIPVLSYDNCDTSGYIRSNSVLTVTVAGGQGHITQSCAEDIARIVNKDYGKVVVYGVKADSEEISKLTAKLAKKGLSFSSIATLAGEIQGLTYYNNSPVYFLNTRVLKDELCSKVTYGKYDTAVRMAKNFKAAGGGEVINEIVTMLISSAPRNVMSFAYKLWHGDAKDIVRNHFPFPFQHIVGEDAVTIVNKKYRQPLKVKVYGDNDALAWSGNAAEITSMRVNWKLLPEWNSGGIIFKLYNVYSNMYLKLDEKNMNHSGGKQARGSTNSNEKMNRYYLEPMVNNGTVEFFIINQEYSQRLKLSVNTDNSNGERILWGHSGTVDDDVECVKWLIAAWNDVASKTK